MRFENHVACDSTMRLMCFVFLLTCGQLVAAEPQTIGAHGVSLAYDPAAFTTVKMRERAAKPAKADYPANVFAVAETFPAHLVIAMRTRYQHYGGVTVLPAGGERPERYAKAYPRVAEQIQALEQLLKERPKIPKGRSEGGWQAQDLPTLRFKNAGQTFLSKVECLTFGWGSAVAYLSQYAQDASDWAVGYNLAYEIHGLTSDGAICVSAEFEVAHRLAPGNEQKRSVEELTGKNLNDRQYADYLSRMEGLLDAQPNESFQPPLNSIHDLLNGIEFRGAKPGRWDSRFKDREITLSPK